MEREHNLSSLTDPFKGDVAVEEMQVWLDQFDNDDKPLIRTLVQHFKYYSSRDVFQLLDQLFVKLTGEFHVDPMSAWFVPVGYVAKSGDAIAYFFRRNNNLPEEAFIRANDLSEARLTERSTVVFLDDFIGSGQDGLRIATEIVKPIKKSRPESRFVFAATVGYSEGIERIWSSKFVEVCVVEELSSQDKPFTEDSKVFPDAETRQKAETIVRRYCKALKSKAPLGYGATQGLIGFFFGTPNNTLPIFWSSEGDWVPLLPYGDSLRDPRRLLQLPQEGQKRVAGEIRSDYTAVQLEDLEISKEATASLYDGFQTLQNMTAAAQLFCRVGLEDRVLHELIQVIQQLQEDRHEGKPVRAALLFPKSENIEEAESRLFLRLKPFPHLSDREQLKTVAQIVDGLEGAVVITSNGEVIGSLLYWQSESMRDPLLPPCYVKAAATTEHTEGFLVLFLGNGRVTILDRGARVLSRRFAKWHVQGVPRNTQNLEAEHGLRSGLLERVLRLAFVLSDSGFGALFTLGDHEDVLVNSGKTAPSYYSWRKLSLYEDDNRPILYLARQDGATIIDGDGLLQQAMTMLQPPATAGGDEEAGKGSRHNAASKISAVTGALAVAVSEDGTITLYSKGRRVFRMMG